MSSTNDSAIWCVPATLTRSTQSYRWRSGTWPSIWSRGGSTVGWPASTAGVTSEKKVVNVAKYYNTDRLRPIYKFDGAPLFIMTSD